MTPFFSPAPLEWPSIPIYIAGVNPYICRLAGERCDGFQAHPFHSVKFLREAVLPNIQAGAAKAGRTRRVVTPATSAFGITGKGQDGRARRKAGERERVAVHAATR